MRGQIRQTRLDLSSRNVLVMSEETVGQLIERAVRAVDQTLAPQLTSDRDEAGRLLRGGQVTALFVDAAMLSPRGSTPPAPWNAGPALAELLGRAQPAAVVLTHRMQVENAAPITDILPPAVLHEAAFADLSASLGCILAPASRVAQRPLLRLAECLLDEASRQPLAHLRLHHIGFQLAASHTFTSLAEVTAAAAQDGVGNVAITPQPGGHYDAVGDGLIAPSRTNAMPQCHLLVGFLEGALTGLLDAPVLGSEIRCRAQGHDACSFRLEVRAALEGSPPVPRDGWQATLARYKLPYAPNE